jgi:hypothetical protein
VLVLMAFGTGLMADAIIDRIRKFARDMVADKDAPAQVQETEKTTVTVKHEEKLSATEPPALPSTSNVT